MKSEGFQKMLWSQVQHKCGTEGTIGLSTPGDRQVGDSLKIDS